MTRIKSLHKVTEGQSIMLKVGSESYQGVISKVVVSKHGSRTAIVDVEGQEMELTHGEHVPMEFDLMDDTCFIYNRVKAYGC